LGKLLLLRLEDGAHRNEPWGINLAPSGFGRFSHDILVVQFCSGQIAAFNEVTECFEGFLVDVGSKSIAIPRSLGLRFGNNGKPSSGTVL
jgi:hypothetical protein